MYGYMQQKPEHETQKQKIVKYPLHHHQASQYDVVK